MAKKLKVLQRKHRRKKKKGKCGGLDEIGEDVSDEMH